MINPVLRAVLFGGGANRVRVRLDQGASVASLSLSSLIVPQEKVHEGILVRSTAAIWKEIVNVLGENWEAAFSIPPDKWEQIIAGAFKNDGYDEVILTPRSGDHGRDVVAIKKGIGSIKILGSVKAFGPGRNVPYDDVRAMLGVLSGERDASKGVITTTTDFPPNVEADPFIGPFLPTRLELLNGTRLREWLTALAAKS